MKPPRITIIGSLNCDISFHVQDFPQANETIMARKTMQSMGGKGLNQAVAAARAGAQTAIIGCVGDDGFGHKALQYAKDNNLDVSGVITAQDTPTGTAGILVTSAKDNMIVVAAGANACLTPDDIYTHKSLIENADMVIAQMETPANTVRAAFEIAQTAGVKTLFNPAPATPDAAALIAYTDIITPNETEVEAITGINPDSPSSARRAAERLCARGAKDIIITLGAAGYYVFTKGAGALFPAFNIDAIDPTGAGDVFNGVLAHVLANGATLHEAARTASAAAAISVTRAGAEGAAPNWPDIQDFLAQIARL